MREQVLATSCPHHPICAAGDCMARTADPACDRDRTNPSRAVLPSGFTLLEILVAFAILSVILACLYSSFFLSRKAVDAVDDTLLVLQESRTLLDAMRREIEAATVQKGKGYTVFKIDDRDFYGKQASHITFTTFSPLMHGLARIEYSVEEEDDGLVLRKKISSAYREGGETSVVLVENLDSFTVEVKSQDTWIKSWNSELTGRAPEEVRVTIIPVPRGTQGEETARPSHPVFEVATIHSGRTL